MTGSSRERRTWAFWGTYDTGKPRTRILKEGLRRVGIDLVEIHSDVWGGIEDKSTISPREWVARALSWLCSYPGLVARFLAGPRPELVVVPYLGQLDAIVLLPFARLRRVPVVLDFPLPLHEAVVVDRGLVGTGNPTARLLRAVDWLALHAADLVVVLSETRARTIGAEYGVAPERFAVVRLGAETSVFEPAPPPATRPGNNDRLQVLFYGQFAPMHGLPTVIEAARTLQQEKIDWTIIGTGQDDRHLRHWIETERPANVTWIDWVPYAELAEKIAAADLCLGLFGTSAKAQVSIPNKVYQAVAVGRAIATLDSDAVRELLPAGSPGVYLVAEPTPEALVATLRSALSQLDQLRSTSFHDEVRQSIAPESVGEVFVREIPFRLGRKAWTKR